MNTNTTLNKGSWIQLNQRQAARAGMILVLLLLTLPATVQAEDYTYITNNGTITILGYIGPGGAVDIPDAINGLPVTIIGDRAFYQCTSLTRVTIPDSVTSIGSYAFRYNMSLTNVTIGTNIISISDWAFADCYSLPSVTIPNSVTTIGNGAFVDCTSLANVMIPASVTNIKDGTFDGCTSLTNVTIPNSVTNVGSYAFYCCSNLTSVTIPNSVIGIGNSTFTCCTRLTRVMIGNGVTSIGGGTFGCCTSLSAITVDALNPVYSSVDGVLFNKSQTTLIQFPNGKAASYTISNSVTTIGDWAFAGCPSLTGIAIPNSVTSIGDYAFNYCTSLTSVTLGNGVNSIGDGAFDNCTSLTGITIPNSVVNIGVVAFSGCTGLSNITIPNSVATIGLGAFRFCSNLTAVLFNGNAPGLESYVFDGDNNATVYYLPGTIGWDTTFGGRPTALWPLPTIQASPQTQTAEAGSAVGFRVRASGSSPLWCVWYLNSTNLLSCSTNCQLDLPNVQLSQSGTYTVVVTNLFGAVTSVPSLLNMIAAVERRPVPGIKVTGESGSLLTVDYADSLSPAPNWTPLGSVSLTGTPQYCFDVTLPLPPQRFYRAWQTGTPGVIPSLDLHPVPAITLTGTIGHSVRLDYINQFGPIDAWVTLDMVELTNTSQLYFDISAFGQPQRLWRIVPVP